MKKAAPKVQQKPASLGTKRSCPQCSTKFYDFDKAEISCPKCETQFDVDKLSHMTRTPVELKRPAPKTPEKPTSDDPLLQAEELVADDTESFESVDELADEDADLVEDLDVDEENEY